MGDMMNEIKLLTGNSHPMLARLVADRCVRCEAIGRKIPELELTQCFQARD